MDEENIRKNVKKLEGMRRLEELRVRSNLRKSIPRFDEREAYQWLIQLDQYFEKNRSTRGDEATVGRYVSMRGEA